MVSSPRREGEPLASRAEDLELCPRCARGYQTATTGWCNDCTLAVQRERWNHRQDAHRRIIRLAPTRPLAAHDDPFEIAQAALMLIHTLDRALPSKRDLLGDLKEQIKQLAWGPQ